MLMTLIQKEMMHHISECAVCCAPADVCSAHTAQLAYQLPSLS